MIKFRIFYRSTAFSLVLFHLCFFLSFLSWPKVALAAYPPPLQAKKGMVVSAHPLASEAGLTILQKGGNAVDAAVATAFAISVVEPLSAGIGGGGFLVLRLAETGEIKALDFREKAPLAATQNMYLDAEGKVRPNASTKGYLAVAVPGTVAGLYEVHHKYGKLSWQEVIAPAIGLANNGFTIGNYLRTHFPETSQVRLDAILSNSAAREIFAPNGILFPPGERLVQQDLARTLRSIAKNPRSFYTGEIAGAIADDMAKNGGLITLEDLKNYQPTWRSPVCGSFKVYQICSMPPPSSGGVLLLEILNIIGDTDIKSQGWHHPDTLHLLVEAMKIAYADRAVYLGDADFFDVPVAALTSRTYAAKRRQEIFMQRARTASEVKVFDRQTLHNLHRESSDTSQISVVDERRNAVSLTFTINTGFGSGVVVPGTGFLLNNEMDDFAVAPGIPNAFGLVGGEANAIAPRKVPLSSMTPVIVTEKDRLRLVTGSPGGSTIITTVLQIILNVLEYNMDVSAAVSAPRIHHQWLPDRIWIEPFSLDAFTLAELRRRGHQIEERNSWGNANAIEVKVDRILEGAADPRGEGSPRGF